MGMRISLFGHMQLTQNDQQLSQRLRPRAKRLLAFLLLNREKALGRENIAFNLWPDTSEKNALSTLRRALNEILNVLSRHTHEEWILSSSGRMQWNPQTNAWLDVDEYQQLAHQGTAESMEAAAKLYKGDLLTDFDEAWIIVERERFRQIQCEILKKLSFHYRSHSQFETALEFTARLIQFDPLSEIAHRELMTLHYLNGDRAGALTAFEQLKNVLEQELGIDPMAETLALRELILRGDPLPEIALPDRPPGVDLGEPETTRLVGRRTEMDELSAAWERASQGRGQQIIISGPAGIGKTHLVEHFSAYAAKRGGVVLCGQCYDFGKSIPFLALRTALLAMHSNLENLPFAPGQVMALGKIIPEISYRQEKKDNGSRNASVDSGTLPELFEAILQAFLLLSRKQPVLLVIEDAHWASEGTLDWLTYASGRLGEGRILVAVTYRTDEPSPNRALNRLQRRLAHQKKIFPLTLKPLSQAEHLELICRLSRLSEAQAGPLSECLYLETEGNPFFLEELVRGLFERGEITTQAGTWSGPFVENPSGAQINLPQSLVETIMLRVDRLSKEGIEFIQGAAVAGRGTSYEVLREAAGWDEGPALQALEETLSRNLIVESQDAAQPALSFTHHLVQDAILAAMPSPKRTYWHRAIGNAIERLYPDAAEQFGDMAHHFFRGRVWEKASAYALRAGDQMASAYADEEARRYYQQALDALDHANASPERKFETVARRIKIGERLGEFEKITDSLAEMEDLARQSADPHLLARALFVRGRFMRLVGPVPRARDILEECSQLCQQLGLSKLLAQALAEISQADFSLLSIRDARAEMERALQIYHRADFPSEAEQRLQYAVALRAWGSMLSRMGRLQEGLETLQESLAILQAMPSPRLDEIAFTQLELGWNYQAIGETAQHLPLLAQAVETLQKIDLRGALVGAHLLQLAIHLGVSRRPLDEARGLLPKLDRWQSRPDIKGMRLGMLAWYEMINGDPRKALPDALESVALFREIGSAGEMLLTLPILSLIHLALGDVEAALAASDEGLGLLGDHEHFTQTTLNFARFRALQAAGREEEAKIYLERSYAALKTRADTLRDPALQQACYDLPFNAEIVSAWEQMQS